MPDLHELLTDAVPPVDPAFGASEVRERARVRDRRARRVVSGVALSVVALLAVVVLPAVLGGGGVRPAGVGELVPLSEWPSSVTFAGVEVGVHVADEPDEAMQRRVPLADGDAALNVMPSDAVRPSTPARQMVVNRLWFSCGAEQVVRVQEIGPADGAPVSADNRLLPIGALVEAAAQLAVQQGCLPTAPTGTPASLTDAQPAIQELSRGLDRAGLAITAGPLGWPEDLPAAPLVNVHVDGLWLPIEVGPPDIVPADLGAASRVLFAAGEAVQAEGLFEGLLVECGTAVLRLQGLGERAAAFASMVEQIGCRPAVPAALRASMALGDLLRSIGVRIVEVQAGGPIAAVLAEHGGAVLFVESGGSSQVGQGEAAHLAIGTCSITHAISSPADGSRAADALLDLLLSHPVCALEAAFGPSDAQPPGPTSDPADPAAVATGDAARMMRALEDAGLDVSSILGFDAATTFEFQPAAPGSSRVWVSVETDPSWPVTADTPLVLLAGGEAAVLPEGYLAFICDGIALRTTGPETGGSEPSWVADLATAVGCDPLPPGLTDADGRGVSVREARLARAFEALGVAACCGEPSHGGAGASTGMVWEGVEVYVYADASRFPDPEYQVGRVIDLAGGQADTGDGDGLPVVAFDCGDTHYSLTHDSTSPDVHVRAAEALVGVLGCTPTVG